MRSLEIATNRMYSLEEYARHVARQVATCKSGFIIEPSIRRARAETQLPPHLDHVEMSLPVSLSNGEIQDRLLLEPFAHLCTHPGKNVRRKLLLAFNKWLNVSMEKIDAIGEVVQMLHNASLLIDDIEDNSVLRRGVPVAHKIFGVASTINSANYVMFIALERIIERLGHPKSVSIYCQQMLELHRGQGMEIYWRDHFKCPSIDEYREMTIRKTGGLFNLAVRLMQLFANEKDDKNEREDDEKDKGNEKEDAFVELTRLLGLYFQIRDDFANLRLQEYEANKSFAEDLTEGKFSFPIIHALQQESDGDRADKIMRILQQRTSDIEVKKYCVQLLEQAGSFDFTINELKKLDQSIRDEIQRLGGNTELMALMDELSNWESD